MTAVTIPAPIEGSVTPTGSNLNQKGKEAPITPMLFSPVENTYSFENKGVKIFVMEPQTPEGENIPSPTAVADRPSVSSVASAATSEGLSVIQVEKLAREQLAQIRNDHADSPLVQTCANEVVPASDTFAIYRNGYKLAITVIALILVALTASGVGAPLALGLVAVGLSVVALATLLALYKTDKLSKQDAIRLALMTVASTFALFFGGAIAANVLVGLYAAAVAIQGALFAGPQGLGAWGKGSWNQMKIAEAAGDKKHVTSAKLDTFGGGMSVAEGSVWMVLGLFMLMSVLHVLCPVIPAAASDEVVAWITDALFFGVFNFSYAVMIGVGLRDLKIQQKFFEKLEQILGEGSPTQYTKEQCLAVLNELRAKLTGRKDQPLSQDLLLKKAHRMSKRLDSDRRVFNLLTIENIDKLTAQLNNEELHKRALEISRIYIETIRADSKRKITFAKNRIKIGAAGLGVGTIVSLFGEVTSPGSLLQMPYVGDTPLDSLSSAATVADCGLWAYMNYCFKKYLDCPEGRTDSKQLEDVEHHFTS